MKIYEINDYGNNSYYVYTNKKDAVKKLKELKKEFEMEKREFLSRDKTDDYDPIGFTVDQTNFTDEDLFTSFDLDIETHNFEINKAGILKAYKLGIIKSLELQN